MMNKNEIIDRLSFIESNLDYYNERIKEAKKIREALVNYFNKYQLNNSVKEWDEEIELRERDRETDYAEYKKAKKMLKLIEQLEELENE